MKSTNKISLTGIVYTPSCYIDPNPNFTSFELHHPWGGRKRNDRSVTIRCVCPRPNAVKNLDRVKITGYMRRGRYGYEIFVTSIEKLDINSTVSYNDITLTGTVVQELNESSTRFVILHTFGGHRNKSRSFMFPCSFPLANSVSVGDVVKIKAGLRDGYASPEMFIKALEIDNRA